MTKRSMPNAGLSLLTASAVTAAGLAVSGWSVSSKPSEDGARPVSTTSTTSSTPSGSEAQAKWSDAASPSASATAQVPAGTRATLGVIGDSASNEVSEWVNLAGAQLGQQRRTLVQRINQGDESLYNDPITYGTKDPQLTVWNASNAAAPQADAARIKKLLPQAPEVVLISEGRDADAMKVAQQLTTTVASLHGVYPKAKVAVVLEPGGEKMKPALDAVRSWANQQGLPTIDVAKTFASTKASQPLQDQNGDPTSAGQALWATTVASAVSAGAQSSSATPSASATSSS